MKTVINTKPFVNVFMLVFFVVLFLILFFTPLPGDELFALPFIIYLVNKMRRKRTSLNQARRRAKKFYTSKIMIFVIIFYIIVWILVIKYLLKTYGLMIFGS